MRYIHVAAITLAIALMLMLPLYRGIAEASTACISELSGNGILTDTLAQDESIDCLSTHRPADAPRAGIYLARYYTFSLDEAADVSITLESSTDTYLYLLEGIGMDGAALYKNDDIDSGILNLNSRIEETLDAGDYTIEATTYGPVSAGSVIEFTLTVSGIAPQSPADDDRAILTALYHATDGDNWTNNDNWLTDAPLNEWHGVSTYDDGRVRGLVLADNQLTGQLPPALGEFHAVETLSFPGNQLTGHIPPELANLTELSRLFISGNQLTGCIPQALRGIEESDLEQLSLPFCEDDQTPEPPDTIPAECVQPLSIDSSIDGAWARGDCVSQGRTEYGAHYAQYYTFTLESAATINLTIESRTDPYLILLDEAGEIIAQDDDDDADNFNLSSDRDSGIRIALGSGDYTIEATTYGNEATGDFTLTLGRPGFTALRALYHATDGDNWDNSDNWLTDAPLADWHGIRTDNEGRLISIYLNDNNLNGEIPAELGQLDHLEGLYLARNDLSGRIPQELGALQNLKALMLFDNDLTGSIPHQLGDLGNLEEMRLGDNRLSGNIPESLGRLSNLQTLYLAGNELRGRIPKSLGSLANLRQISLAANNLSGSVPVELANLENLTHLYIWNNQLTAEDFIRRIGDLDNLEVLDIGGNRIDGAQVLAQADNIPNLNGLGIHDSDISDADLLEYMDDLHSLNLDFLNIGANGLSDSRILARLANMKTLYRLAIHDNMFAGELPRAMTGLTLRAFYFHNNAGLCAPADADFQRWLSGIHRYDGDICAGGAPAHAPAPASVSTDQFAAIPQTPEQQAPRHSLSVLVAGLLGG